MNWQNPDRIDQAAELEHVLAVRGWQAGNLVAALANGAPVELVAQGLRLVATIAADSAGGPSSKWPLKRTVHSDARIELSLLTLPPKGCSVDPSCGSQARVISSDCV